MGKRPFQNPALRGEQSHARHDAREAPTLKRDVPPEILSEDQNRSVITTKLRKKDIEDMLLEQEAKSKLVEEDDDDEAKKKKKTESGIRAPVKDRSGEPDPVLDRFDRFERREVLDTIPAPPENGTTTNNDD